MMLGAKTPSARTRRIKLFVNVATMFVAIFLGIGLTYAYFTARATSQGEILFANISADFVDATDQVYTQELLTQQLGKIKPGDNIQLEQIYVKNIGEYDIYALIEVTFEAFKYGETTASYTTSSWYNLSGTKITGDVATTTVEATMLAVNTKAEAVITFSVPGSLDNAYKNGSANIKAKAHVIQSLLEKEAGVSTAVTASRLIYQHKDQQDVEHTVYIRPNGGSYNSSTDNVTISQERGTTLTLGTPTRTGYTFTGWTFSGDGSLTDSIYTFGKSVGVITANWQANNYKVSFEYNNGANPNLFDERTLLEHGGVRQADGSIYIETPSTAYKQIVYKNTNNYQGQISFSCYGKYTLVNQYEPLLLYIVYTDSSFEYGRICNNSNGEYKYFEGTTSSSKIVDNIIFSYGSNNPSYVKNFKIEESSTPTAYTAPQKIVSYDSVYGELPTPTREGYAFGGWQIARKFSSGHNVTISSDNYSVTSDSQNVDTYFDITSCKTITGNTYTITFNAQVNNDKSWAYLFFQTTTDYRYVKNGYNEFTFVANVDKTFLTFDDLVRTLDDPFTITDFTFNDELASILSSDVFKYDEDVKLCAEWIKHDVSAQSASEKAIDKFRSNEIMSGAVDLYFDFSKQYS